MGNGCGLEDWHFSLIIRVKQAFESLCFSSINMDATPQLSLFFFFSSDYCPSTISPVTVSPFNSLPFLYTFLSFIPPFHALILLLLISSPYPSP
jgi:hypothetical protein